LYSSCSGKEFYKWSNFILNIYLWYGKEIKMVDEKEHTNIGRAAFVLGAVSIVLVFLPWIGLSFRSDVVAVPMAILAVVLGYFARKHGDSYGRIGLVLGVITLIIMVVIVTLTTPVYVEGGPLLIFRPIF
jgi:hypothetical protein